MSERTSNLFGRDSAVIATAVLTYAAHDGIWNQDDRYPQSKAGQVMRRMSEQM
jgi:hypothetical protein